MQIDFFDVLLQTGRNSIDVCKCVVISRHMDGHTHYVILE